MSDYSSGTGLESGKIGETDTSPSNACFNIRVAGLIGKDYLLLISDQNICLQQAIIELLPYFADDLLLEQEDVEVITIHPDAVGNNCYSWYNIRWFNTGPKLVSSSKGDSKSIPFIETLMLHSISID